MRDTIVAGYLAVMSSRVAALSLNDLSSQKNHFCCSKALFEGLSPLKVCEVRVLQQLIVAQLAVLLCAVGRNLCGALVSFHKSRLVLSAACLIHFNQQCSRSPKRGLSICCCVATQNKAHNFINCISTSCLRC